MSIFGTSGVRGSVGEDVTAETALSLGRALGSTHDGTVVVGRDARPSGEWLTPALVAGLRECGVDVVALGRVATPTLARSVDRRGAVTGVMVTASHNPAGDNGFKFWTESGRTFDAERRRRLTDRVCTKRFDLQPGGATGDVDAVDDATANHRRALQGTVGNIDSLSVVVDVGNGMGGVTVETLRALGCSVRTLDGRPDGTFPARPNEPTADHCRTLRECVAATDADLGIAHDGDADRMMAVTESGAFVPGDVLLALFARETASEGDRIAAPINTSFAVDEELARIGASVTRTQVGDVHVAEQAAKEDVVFGGEPSGTWIWPDETYCPDGPLAACRLAALVDDAGSFDALVDDITRYPIRRYTVDVDAKSDVVQNVRRTVGDEYGDARITTTDGVRVDDDGWFLVRASGTQPLVRITAEADSGERADELLDTASTLVERSRP